jgi:hypothetical protein
MRQTILAKNIKKIDVLSSHRNHRHTISYIPSIVFLKDYFWYYYMYDKDKLYGPLQRTDI